MSKGISLTRILIWVMAPLVMCAFATSVLAQPSGCPPGMTGYWKFDESSGGPYDDFYGVNDATCTSCPATVAGKLGNGLDFDGVNNRVDVPDDDSFDWGEFTSFTIEFWMRSSGCGCTEGGYNCNQVVAGRAVAGWWIGVNCQTLPAGNINKLRCVFGTIGGPTDFYSNASVNDDVWHHVVYQFDRAAGPSGRYLLYIDGELDNSVYANGATRAGAGPIQLGYYGTAYQYAGLLDEFAVYNQALSVTDIQSHYNSGNGQSYCISNQAPVVSDIPGETIAEGGSFTQINLDTYVADPDNLDSEINWTYSGNSNLSVTIDANRVATIAAMDAEWNGSETITFTATDPGPLSASDPATFTVTAVNDAPVVSDIPDESVAEGTGFATIDLDTYVTDPDNLDTEINWAYSGNVNLSVSIDVDRVATITVINPEWNGSETITFTATDPGPLSASDPATFTVTAVNDAPVVSDIPGQTVPEGTAFATIDLDTYVTDPDNLVSEITWTYSGNTNLNVSISPSHVATITVINPEWNGGETITFTATDPGPLSDSDPATFIVTPVNDAPVVSDIPDQSILEGQSFTTIVLDDFVSDPDNLDSDLEWTYSGNSALIVNISLLRIATITTPSPTWTGSETITFRAADPDEAFDLDVATFTVSSEGCPPGMTHYWQLNETVGAPYYDSFGGTDAICTNCPTPVAGLVDGAQEFDRLTDQVTVVDDDSFDWGVGSSFTIEFWLNKSSGCAGGAQANNEVVVGRSAGGWWVGVMCESGTNQTKIRAYFQGVDLFSTSSVTDANWHHVAVVRDNSANQWLMYVDGVLETSQLSAGKNLGASTPLEIGWYNGPDPGKYRLGAILDELALYDAALTPGTIAIHHAEGLIGNGYCTFSNSAPLITTSPVTSARVGELYTYDVNAEGLPLPTYSLDTYPAGMTIAGVSGLIEWTPTAAGSFNVVVEATNSEGIDTQPFTIVVDPATGCPGDMTHYWDFDEIVGGNYDDLVGGADAFGTSFPAAIPGKVDGAQLFDRVDDQLLVPDDDSYDWSATDSYSIEFWMKADCGCTAGDYTCNEVILSRFDIGNPWWIGLSCRTSENPGKLRCYFGASTDLYSTVNVNDEVWHHVVFTRDNGLNECRLYVDGVLNTTLAVSGLVRAGVDKPMQVGWANGAPFYRYGGALDELAIYNDVLSESRIALHYSGGAYCALCGDADGSGGVNISDAVYLINYIFSGGPAPNPLLSADADCNGTVNISDAVYLINYIFSGGAAPCAACK